MPRNPKPFSSDWLETPPRPPERPRRLTARINTKLLTLAPRLPAERTLSMFVVLVLVMASFWFASPRGAAIEQPPPDDLAMTAATAMPTTAYDEVDAPPAPTISTDSLKVVEQGAASTEGSNEAITPPTFNLQHPQTQTNTEGGLFPDHRILTFYGFPGDDQMGILGQHSMDELLGLLRDQAAAYEEADPSRPVLIAMEVIASVAQSEPQVDGSYISDAPSALLDTYADFAEENGILLFLDVQIGYRSVQQEVEALRPWLEKPFVHLAIDPEFSMRDGEIPGHHVGQIDGSDVTWTQEYLAQLATDAGIPPKVLIVHQFLESMIENKDTIAPVKGVQLVIDCDGFGTPADKRATYDVVNGAMPIEYNGLKLFYDQDVPLLTPDEVLNLNPSPDLIIYQ